MLTRCNCAFILFLSAALFAPLHSASAADGIDFVRDVQPILASHCYKCHGEKHKESGLRWDRKASGLFGGDSGEKSIVPGKPAESRLIKVLTGKDTLKMPKEGAKLTADEVATLTRWVEQGAVWPDGVDPKESKPPHWAFSKPVRPALPEVQHKDWARNGVDRFILARLEKEGLTPNAEADRYTLCRRVYLDLIGLPPTPAEVNAFVNDKRPDAYEKLVDDLMSRPQYGEKWARMWLDLARYADSAGYGSDPLRANIWPFRDWVIDAFNANKPFDQFTIEQIAGDLLPNATSDQILATAFHRNTMTNTEGGTDDEEFRVAAIKDRIGTTMQVWMGLTMGCAQCHSHKYDPITQREYYSFFAIFNQTADSDKANEEPRFPTPTAAQRAKVVELETQIAALRQSPDAETPETKAAQAEWEKSATGAKGAWVPLQPTSATATSGAKLTEGAGHIFLVSGPESETDTYTITAPANVKTITAMRLETMTDASLGMKGPGRNGNFVLSEIQLTVTPPAAATAKPISGRFVRLELPGSQRFLHVAEVQVMSGGANLALKGKASQSSTAFDGPANLAIDGNTNGEYEDGKSVTHTEQQDNPWWEVDLGGAKPIDSVVVWNRTDNGLQERMNGVRIVVLDESRKPVWHAELATAPKESAEVSPSGAHTIGFRAAHADFNQADFDVMKSIDRSSDKTSGWAIAPEVGKQHAAVFETAETLTLEPGSVLTVSLVQNYPKHAIGRFRLSVTGASTGTLDLPERIEQLLSVEPAKRTAAQAAELSAYYRSIAPRTGGGGAAAQIATLEAQLNQLRGMMPKTPIMKELAGNKRRTSWMLIKGNYLNHGDTVQPAMLESFHPLPAGASPDRLGVAKWLISKDNPLTARVTANRFWAQLFGRGIVETEEDFGTQGSPPSHPELLDWLAVEFMDSNWNIRSLLKTIVTSATYRQSARVSPAALEKDPANRLLSRSPRNRLEAEMVRDQALALSGLLSQKMYGPSVFPVQPAGLWRAAFNGERTWATSAGEDKYRRGLYTFWRRTVPYPSMSTFDAPSREICTLRRVRTNTPLQALVTLNDPVYVEAAQALARRMTKDGGASPADRIRFGLALCTAKPAQDVQINALLELYNSELQRFQKDSTAAIQIATDPLGPLPKGMETPDLAAMTVVANVLLNLDGVLTKG